MVGVEKTEWVVGQFKAIYQVNEQIDSINLDKKELNKAIKNIKVGIADELELSPTVIERAYKDWIYSTEHPDVYDAAGELTEKIRYLVEQKKLED